MLSDEQLSRLAEAALLNEAKKGAQRAEMAGPSGWLKPKIPSTNKLFLHNTIRGALAANHVKDQKRREMKQTKLEMLEKRLKEQNRYKRLYLQASTKLKDKESVTKLAEKMPGNLPTKSPSVNGVAWKDDGLEISCSIKTRKEVKNPKLVKKMSRNIKFVSQSINGYDKRFDSNMKDDP